MIGMFLGIPVALVGAFAGAAAVTRLGIYRALWLLGAIALASNFTYAAAALPQMGSRAIYAAAFVESLSGWLASIAFMSFLMRICEKEHAAVQYALLTALYALTGTLASMPSGWFVDHVGYATYFRAHAAQHSRGYVGSGATLEADAIRLARRDRGGDRSLRGGGVSCP